MNQPEDIASWLSRGQQLKCFSDDLSQLRYLKSWEDGDHKSVLSELDRIFTSVHRLPTINWVNRPDVVTMVMRTNDGPVKLPEDWKDSDFLITHPDGESINGTWILTDGAWDDLLTALTNNFIFLSLEDRINTINKWDRDTVTRLNEYPLSLDTLVARSNALRFMTEAKTSSWLMSYMPLNHSYHADALTVYNARIDELMEAWLAVSDRSTMMTNFLTIEKLYKCKHMLDIDTLLSGATSIKSKNLMEYLRCKDFSE